MNSASPLPPIAYNWYKYRYDYARGWEVTYLAHICAFKSLFEKESDVATQETINQDEP